MFLPLLLYFFYFYIQSLLAMIKTGFIFLCFIWVLTSCNTVLVTIGEAKKVKMLGMSGQEIVVGIIVPVYNPNKYAITIRKLDIQVFQGDELLGEIRDVPQIRLNSRDTTDVDIKAYLEFGDFLSGGLSLLRLYSMKNVELTLKGTASASTVFTRKRFSVDEKFILRLGGKD